MTNLLTNLIASLSIFITTKTNPQIAGVYSDAPPCAECGVVHHSIVKSVYTIVEQRWLIGTLEGAPIKLLVSEVVLSEPTSVKVVAKPQAKPWWENPSIIQVPSFTPTYRVE